MDCTSPIADLGWALCWAPDQAHSHLGGLEWRARSRCLLRRCRVYLLGDLPEVALRISKMRHAQPPRLVGWELDKRHALGFEFGVRAIDIHHTQGDISTWPSFELQGRDIRP